MSFSTATLPVDLLLRGREALIKLSIWSYTGVSNQPNAQVTD